MAGTALGDTKAAASTSRTPASTRAWTRRIRAPGGGGPRGGLQGEAPTPPGARIRLVQALVDAGVREVEAAAFVSPRAVPAMAGGAEVMAGLPRREGVRYWALVPNLRGAEMGLEAVAGGLSVTVSASPAYSRRNVGMEVEESVAQAAAICGLAGGRVPVDVVVSCAFGWPYEGDLERGAVAALGRRLTEGGATSLTYADTT